MATTQYRRTVTLVDQIRNALRNGHIHTPLWWKGYNLYPPHFTTVGYEGKPPRVVYPEDYLIGQFHRKMSLETSEGLKRLFMLGAQSDIRWFHDPAHAFALKQYEYMTRDGFSEKKAWRKTEQYFLLKFKTLQLENLYASQQVQQVNESLSKKLKPNLQFVSLDAFNLMHTNIEKQRRESRQIDRSDMSKRFIEPKLEGIDSGQTKLLNSRIIPLADMISYLQFHPEHKHYFKTKTYAKMFRQAEEDTDESNKESLVALKTAQALMSTETGAEDTLGDQKTIVDDFIHQMESNFFLEKENEKSKDETEDEEENVGF